MPALEEILDNARVTNPHIRSKLGCFFEQVLKFNDKLGLVSKSSPEAEVLLQIDDCLSALKALDISFANTLLDIGSGAGIPGLIFKICRPQIELVSLDSNPRKIAFQERLSENLGLKSVEFVSRTLKSYSPNCKFDLVTAKAFGQFEDIFRFAHKNLACGGRLVLFLASEQSLSADIESRKPVKKLDILTYNLFSRREDRLLKIIQFES